MLTVSIIFCLRCSRLSQPLDTFTKMPSKLKFLSDLLPQVVSCASPNQLLLKFGNHFGVFKICAAAGRRVVQSGYVVVHWRTCCVAGAQYRMLTLFLSLPQPPPLPFAKLVRFMFGDCMVGSEKILCLAAQLE